MGTIGVALRPAILLDRDGTLIDVVRDEETGTIHVAFHPAQLRLLPRVLEGLALLREAGFTFAIATNQPGPAKGEITAAAVERTNSALVAALAKAGIVIEAVRACLHHPEGRPGGDSALVKACDCRKPRPGLLRALMAELGLDPARTWMVGDSVSDLEAAHAAGIRSALLFATNRCELCPLRRGPGSPTPHVCGPDMLTVARAILAAG